MEEEWRVCRRCLMCSEGGLCTSRNNPPLQRNFARHSHGQDRALVSLEEEEVVGGEEEDGSPCDLCRGARASQVEKEEDNRLLWEGEAHIPPLPEPLSVCSLIPGPECVFLREMQTTHLN